MAGEQRSCCCNHDDPQATHQVHLEHELGGEAPLASTSSDCCGTSLAAEASHANHRGDQAAATQGTS